MVKLPRKPEPIVPAPVLPRLTPEQELDAGYRVQQKLIDLYAPAGTVGAELVGWNRNWWRQVVKLHTRIGELRAIVELPEPGEEMDSPESQARYARKMAARQSKTYDKALEKHPLLTVTVKAAVALDPLQVFTAPNYTELDAGGHIAVAANALTMTALPQNVDAWVYKDFGAAFFGDFEHTMWTEATNFSLLSTVGAFWAVSNVVDDLRFWQVNNSEALDCLWWCSAGPTYCIYLTNRETPVNDYVAPLALAEDYFLKFVRSGASLTAAIYPTEQDRIDNTNRIDLLTVAVNAARTYRHVFPAVSYNNASGRNATYVSADLDLGLGIVPFRRRIEGY